MTQVTVVMLNTGESHGNYIFDSLLNIPAASQNMDYQMIFKIKNDNVNKKVQLDAAICRHLFTAKSLYMFRASQHPSSGVLKH